MTDRDQHPSDRPERTQKRLEHAGSTRRETLKTVGTVGLAGLTGTGVASVSSAHGSRGNEFERSTADSVAPGETIWQFEVEAAPDYGISSSPTVVDGTVVFGTDGGNVYALDAATGSQQWSYDLIGSTSASAAIYDGTVFIVNSGGDFVALDLQTGQKQWEFNGDAAYLDNQLMSSPLLSEGTLYVGMGDGNLYALDADSGEMEWTFQTGNPIKTSPVRSGERICIGSASTLYGINAETGEESGFSTVPKSGSGPRRRLTGRSTSVAMTSHCIPSTPKTAPDAGRTTDADRSARLRRSTKTPSSFRCEPWSHWGFSISTPAKS